MKTCFTCKEELPANKEFFNGDKSKRDGLNSNCKKCRAKKRNKTESTWSKVEDGKKSCNECKRWFPATLKYFHRHNRGTGGLYPKCKECRGIENKIYFVNKVNRPKAGFKYCSRCHEYLPESEVRKSSNSFLCLNCNRLRSLRNANLRRENRSLTPVHLRLSQDDWECAIKKFSNKCAYCGAKGKLTQDHYIPMNSGGYYSRCNMLPVCPSCNFSKGDKSFLEWFKEQAFYSKERVKLIDKYIGKYQQPGIQ